MMVFHLAKEKVLGVFDTTFGFGGCCGGHSAPCIADTFGNTLLSIGSYQLEVTEDTSIAACLAKHGHIQELCECPGAARSCECAALSTAIGASRFEHLHTPLGQYGTDLHGRTQCQSQYGQLLYSSLLWFDDSHDGGLW